MFKFPFLFFLLFILLCVSLSLPALSSKAKEIFFLKRKEKDGADDKRIRIYEMSIDANESTAAKETLGQDTMGDESYSLI